MNIIYYQISSFNIDIYNVDTHIHTETHYTASQPASRSIIIMPTAPPPLSLLLRSIGIVLYWVQITHHHRQQFVLLRSIYIYNDCRIYYPLLFTHLVVVVIKSPVAVLLLLLLLSPPPPPPGAGVGVVTVVMVVMVVIGIVLDIALDIILVVVGGCTYLQRECVVCAWQLAREWQIHKTQVAGRQHQMTARRISYIFFQLSVVRRSCR